MRRTLVLLFVFLTGFSLFGQPDSTLLTEVEVVEKRVSEFAVGSQFITLDSSRLSRYEAASLAEILKWESGIYIKQYSPGNLASTSFRGANAQQTALTWNGFNINSPLNGLFDLSLFPVSSFEEVQIQPGASSALWGSGALGGSIHLNSQASFSTPTQLTLSTTIGSFGFDQENLAIKWSNRKVAQKIALLHLQADNDFDFTNPFTGEIQQQSNSELETFALLSDNTWKASKVDLISANLWLQNTLRQIPPTLFETVRSSQEDHVLRLALGWIHNFENSSLKVRTAWFDEDQEFINLTGDTSYLNRQKSLIAETEYKFSLGTYHKAEVGFNHTSTFTDVQSYGDRKIDQHREAVFIGYKWDILRNLKFSTMLRQEVVDGNRAPFTYTLGMKWAFWQSFHLQGQFSRVYRIPTLNDRYWQPGGNQELQSEEGYAQDLSLGWQKSKEKTTAKITLTAFNRNISNWIIWQPNAGVWTPQNLLKVWSRGLEATLLIGWKSEDFNINFRANGNYTLSTNTSSLRPDDASLNKQLIYTPIYSATASLNMIYKVFQLNYTHSYTGYTYTNSDHSSYLYPYQPASLDLSIKYRLYKIPGRFFFRIDNLWNENYQVVRNRPMPGINYRLGTTINLNFKKP